MSDISTGALAGAAVAVNPTNQKRGFLRTCARAAWWVMRPIPLFAYFLAVFVAVKYTVADVRAVFFTAGSYAFTYVEVLIFTAFVVAVSELMRVAKPGVDNTRQALFMLAVAVGYLILFLLGAVGVPGFYELFSNTEFLTMLFYSSIQVIMAFLVNSATLKRTIDNTDSHNS
jgi:hypothetical protein